jgi:hypothetical protein
MLDHVDCPLLVSRSQSMIDGLAEQLTIGEPSRCRGVELADPLGMITRESSAQVFGEEVVVSEPVAVVVDAAQEQISALDVFEHRLPTLDACECRREAAADSSGNRGGHEEFEQPRFEGPEHILGQEFTDG